MVINWWDNVFILNIKNISIEVLKVFLNLEIVNVKKYVGNKGLIYVEDEWVGVFLRAMLFYRV